MVDPVPGHTMKFPSNFKRLLAFSGKKIEF